MSKIYLAGPMRGIKDFNFPLFHATAAELRKQGHEVFNPAEHDENVYGVGFNKSENGFFGDIPFFNIRSALLFDLMELIQNCDTIALLPGWENSSGAKAEYWAAKAIGLKVIELKIEREEKK